MPMPVPQRFTFAAPATPSGEAINVGQMYTLFAQAIRGGKPYPVPIEDVLHGMAVFDALVESAKTGAIVAVSSTRS